jgi:hypothetical protein
MLVTKQMMVEQLARYLKNAMTKEQLVDWCEKAMMESAFENETVKEIAARLGLMDVTNFDVSFEELSLMLEKLGHRLKVEVV